MQHIRWSLLNNVVKNGVQTLAVPIIKTVKVQVGPENPFLPLNIVRVKLYCGSHSRQVFMQSIVLGKECS